jgi:hypothetical protein
MAFIDPASHQLELKDGLVSDGWRVEVADTDSTEWWLHSLWRLESVWRPVGCAVWVGFVGDPAHVGAHMRVADRVLVSSARPQDRFAKGFELSSDWPTHRAVVIAAAAVLRDRVGDAS